MRASLRMLPPRYTCIVLLALQAHAHMPRTTGWVKPPTPDGVTACDFSYEIDGAPYTGYAAFPAAAAGEAAALPGVLVAHQWYGLGEMEQYRAEEMASKMNYAAFALDVYGTGVRATNDAEAEALMDALLADPAELHKRIDAGMAQLAAVSATSCGSGKKEAAAVAKAAKATTTFVNASALTANGYCFGGLMVLELARTGGAVLGVTSFHGELGNITAQSNDAFRPGLSVAVHHAQNDFQGDAALRGIEAEFEAQNVSHWTTTYYGHVEHGWTDPTQASYRYLEAESAHAAMFGLYDLLIPK